MPKLLFTNIKKVVSLARVEPCDGAGCVSARAVQLARQTPVHLAKQHDYAARLNQTAALESALEEAWQAPEPESMLVAFTGAGQRSDWTGPPRAPPGPPIEQLLQSILHKMNEMHEALGKLHEMHEAIGNIDQRLRTLEALVQARPWNGWGHRSWQEGWQEGQP